MCLIMVNLHQLDWGWDHHENVRVRVHVHVWFR